MSWDYTPMSEEEVQKARYKLMDDGEYNAVVNKATDRLSASGNQMTEFDLTVYDNNGHGHPMKDFLVNLESMLWKQRHFCYAAGLVKEYEEKKFCGAICENRNVRVKVTFQAGKEIPYDKLKGKAPGARYPDKNVIEDYIDQNAAPIKQNNASAEHAELPFNDDIPF